MGQAEATRDQLLLSKAIHVIGTFTAADHMDQIILQAEREGTVDRDLQVDGPALSLPPRSRTQSSFPVAQTRFWEKQLISRRQSLKVGALALLGGGVGAGVAEGANKPIGAFVGGGITGGLARAAVKRSEQLRVMRIVDSAARDALARAEASCTTTNVHGRRLEMFRSLTVETLEESPKLKQLALEHPKRDFFVFPTDELEADPDFAVEEAAQHVASRIIEKASLLELPRGLSD